MSVYFFFFDAAAPPPPPSGGGQNWFASNWFGPHWFSSYWFAIDGATPAGDNAQRLITLRSFTERRRC